MQQQQQQQQQRVVVVVTGCSEHSLGWHLAAEFAARGCSTHATARRLDAMRGLAERGCALHRLDVTDAAAAEALLRRVAALEGGRLDVLVNCAGAMLKAWAIDAPCSAVEELFAVNTLAPIALCGAAARVMLEASSSAAAAASSSSRSGEAPHHHHHTNHHHHRRRGGVIVNVGSAAGFVAVPQAAAYSASKFALRAYSDALRVELAPFGISVVYAALGVMKTPLFRRPRAVVAPPGLLLQPPPPPHPLPPQSGAGGRGESGDHQQQHQQQVPPHPYARFDTATRELLRDDATSGLGGVAATDPAVVARRLAGAALRRRPPRTFVAGWLGWPIVLLGWCAPLCLTDWLASTRLGLRR